MFYNKERNLNRRNALMDALQSSRLDTRNNITPFQPVQPRQSAGGESVLGGASNLLSGAGNLYRGLQESGLFGSDKGLSIYDDVNTLSTPSFSSGSLLGNSINDNVLGNTSSDYGIFGNAANDYVLGNTSDSSLIGDAIGNSTGGGFVPYVGIAKGGLNAGMSALNGGSFKDDVPQAFFGIDDSDSEIMQALKGTGNGVMMGLPFGPIGMAVGGLLGLGTSFMDDIG